MSTDSLALPLALIEGHHLLGLVDDYITLLDGTRADDPALDRLTPRAYADDDAATLEFRQATRDDLLDRRLTDALEVRTSLEDFDIEIDPDSDAALREQVVHIEAIAVDTWLRTLSTMRLVIASRLGIDRDDTHAPDDPRFGVYDWLGYRLDQLVLLADESASR